MSAPTVTITRARGQARSDPGTDFAMCIVGYSSASPLATGALSQPYYRPDAAVSDYGIGDGVDALCQALDPTDDNPAPPGVSFLSTLGMSGLVAGVRGAITISGVTGTAIVAATSDTPLGTWEPRVRVSDDGASGAGTAIGTTGIVLEASLDNGRTWLPTRALGTATSFELKIPNPGGTDYSTGVKWAFEPAASAKSALFTKVTLLQTTLTGTGHFVDVTSSVHLAADTTDDTALAAVPAATTNATCVALFNACLSYLGIHGANLTYHTIADATLATALAAIPMAVNVADVDLHLPALIAAYNAHRINTTGTVHGSADNTNTITAYTSAPGTLKTGDVWYEAKATPPQWAIADLYTAGSPASGALADIAKSSQNFGIVALTEPVVAGNIATLSSALDAMKAIKPSCRPTLVVRFRDQGPSESDATYIAAWQTFRAACASDARILAVVGDGWLTDAFRSYVLSRNGLPEVLARIQGRAAIPGVKGERIAQALWWTGRGPLKRFTIRDTSGNPVGHDEAVRGGILGPIASKGGGLTFMYEAHEQVAGTYIAGDPTLHDVLPTVRTFGDNNLSSGIERTLYAIAFLALGGADVVVNGKLDQGTRDSMASAAMRAIKELYATEFANPEDPNLVTVDELVTVSGPNVTVRWYVHDELYRYTHDIIVTLGNTRS